MKFKRDRRVDTGSELASEMRMTGRYPHDFELELEKDSEYDDQLNTNYHLKQSLFQLSKRGYFGGRNESYAYGESENRMLYDYDLKSAYTSILMDINAPDFNDIKEVTELTEEILKGDNFIIAIVSFKFDEKIQYPSLPVRLKNNKGLLFPKSGKTIACKEEIIEALRLGCSIKLIIGYSVGVLRDDNNSPIKPFKGVITNLNKLRKEYESGSFGNHFFKQVGNSIYGKTGQGLSEKQKFSFRNELMETVGPSSITNPVVAATITSRVRTIMSMYMNRIHELGGLLFSCTTDGFITDLPRVDEWEPFTDELHTYSLSVEVVYGHRKILEQKTMTEKLISLKTRGQISPFDKNSVRIKALSGLSSYNIDYETIRLHLHSHERRIRYYASSLRGAIDIFKKGGHVTPDITIRSYNLGHDLKRNFPSHNYTPCEPIFGLPYESDAIYYNTKKLESWELNRTSNVLPLLLASKSSKMKTFIIHTALHYLKSLVNYGVIDISSSTPLFNDILGIKLTPGYYKALLSQPYILNSVILESLPVDLDRLEIIKKQLINVVKKYTIA